MIKSTIEKLAEYVNNSNSIQFMGVTIITPAKVYKLLKAGVEPRESSLADVPGWLFNENLFFPKLPFSANMEEVYWFTVFVVESIGEHFSLDKAVELIEDFHGGEPE